MKMFVTRIYTKEGVKDYLNRNVKKEKRKIHDGVKKSKMAHDQCPKEEIFETTCMFHFRYGNGKVLFNFYKSFQRSCLQRNFIF